MPIRSQNVTAPQDRPHDEPKPPVPEPQPEPQVDAPKDEPKGDDSGKGADKDDEPSARHRSRVIALPTQTVTDDDGSTRQVPDFLGLEVESCEPTDTDYGNVAKYKVKASKDALDELEARAHEALTYKRTVPARGA